LHQHVLRIIGHVMSWTGFHLCTVKVPMVYIIDQLECATYQCYFINALFDIFF